MVAKRCLGMCLATAYLNRGSKEPILRDVAHMRFDGDTVEMETLLGEERVILGGVLELISPLPR